MSMKDDRACFDAGTLAAWADDALDARERGAVEAHAAGCVRCQALLAAMVKTMPEPAVAPSPWRMPALGWLVPIAAAATAVAIWVAVPNREPQQRSQSAETAADQTAAAPPPHVPAASAPQAKAPDDIGASSQLAREQDAPAARPSADVKEQREAAPLEKQASPAEANALADAAGAARAAPARLSAFANIADTIVVSSNPATRFKLLPGGGVQRSADGGATWRNESTGATTTLTAGSSPSPSVCWLIGPSGTVLLSTDGSWRRLAFPERADLLSIDATDQDNATVTTVDGRAFVTADGGETWARVPGF